MARLRVAACHYPIDLLPGFAAYSAKVEALVAEAAAAGAQLALFPEYGAMELTGLLPAPLRADLRGQLAAMQGFAEPFLDLYSRLAQRYGVYLLAPSFPWQVGTEYRNRAWFCSPTGTSQWQEKLIMTRFERESWGVSRGEGLRLFTTPFGRIGVLICYDSEFPLLARALAEAGAEILLVPSCTDTQAGWQRVRTACRARALEGQCYVVQAPTVGEAAWSPAVDINIGWAAAFCPPDYGLPESGVVAEGTGQPGWLLIDLDLERLAQVRRAGQVLNLRDWPEQGQPTVVVAEC